MRHLQVAIEAFSTDLDRLPRSLSELTRGQIGNGPYLEDVFRDPWDHPYCYTSIRGEVSLISAGPNGEFGDSDDLNHAFEMPITRHEAAAESRESRSQNGEH